MHARFVIRRSWTGSHQIVDVHGNLIATMNGQHPDVEELAALFLQSPIADYLAKAAEPYVDGAPIDTMEQHERKVDWLQSLEHYRLAKGEVPTT